MGQVSCEKLSCFYILYSVTGSGTPAAHGLESSGKDSVYRYHNGRGSSAATAIERGE